jgi:hypothetical protein
MPGYLRIVVCRLRSSGLRRLLWRYVRQRVDIRLHGYRQLAGIRAILAFLEDVISADRHAADDSADDDSTRRSTVSDNFLLFL